VRGVGSAWGAISFLNALFTGIGAAAAIDLRVTARVEIEPAVASPAVLVTADEDCDTPLARAALASACRQFGGGTGYRAHLTVASEIPPSKGLKSSSAVSVAIGRAVGNGFGRTPSPESLARLSAVVSREVGLSATGAFDDAMASAGGGIVVTENAPETVLSRVSAPSDWSIVLWTGAGSHDPSVEWHHRFQGRADAAAPAVAAARRGDFLTAMTENTRLVEPLLGSDFAEWRGRLESLGALASGVSGLGPSLATIVRREDRDRVARDHPAGRTAVHLRDFVGVHDGRSGSP